MKKLLLTSALMLTIISASFATCPTPTALSAISISSDSAVLKWNSAIGLCTACYNNVRYKKSTSSTWTNTSARGINPNTKSISGLTPSTTYQFQVQSVCNSTPGIYSAIATFTTSAAVSCPTPTALSAISIGSDSAVLKWNSAIGLCTACYNNVRYKKSTSSTWTITSARGINPNTKSISGLTPSTTYQFQVQSVCNSTPGIYSASQTFTTLSAYSCPMPAGLSAASITSTSATLGWTAVSGGNNYSVRYKKTSSTTWTTATVGTNSKSVSGLTAATTYEFQVETFCNLSTSGGYSSSKTFTTLSKPHSPQSGNNISGDVEESIQATATQKTILGENLANINVYPNPAQGFTTIHFDGATEKAAIKVFDVMGQIVFSDNINSNTYILHVENLPTGIYQIVLQTETESYVRKLMVQKL